MTLEVVNDLICDIVIKGLEIEEEVNNLPVREMPGSELTHPEVISTQYRTISTLYCF